MGHQMEQDLEESRAAILINRYDGGLACDPRAPSDRKRPTGRAAEATDPVPGEEPEFCADAASA